MIFGRHSVLKRGCSTWDRRQLPAAVFHSRVKALRQQMAQRRLGALVIYGDNYSFADLCYLTNYFPKVRGGVAVVPRERADGWARAAGDRRGNLIAGSPQRSSRGTSGAGLSSADGPSARARDRSGAGPKRAGTAASERAERDGGFTEYRFSCGCGAARCGALNCGSALLVFENFTFLVLFSIRLSRSPTVRPFFSAKAKLPAVRMRARHKTRLVAALRSNIMVVS